MRESTTIIRTSLATLVVGATIAAPVQAALVKAIEYAGDHMFLSAHPAEIEALDSGAVPGWVRTGVELWVHDAPGPDVVPVCRFYSAAFVPRSSHFCTADAAECAAVRGNRDWVYEGTAFYAWLPGDYGRCPPGSWSVDRWHNGGRGGAPNHLYQPYTNSALHDEQMHRVGWLHEGTAFCTYAQSPRIWDRSTPASAATGLLAGSRWRIVTAFDPGEPSTAGLVLAIGAEDPSGRLLAKLDFTASDGKRHILHTPQREAAFDRGDEFVHVLDLYDDASFPPWTLWAEVEFVLTGRDAIAVCVAMRQIDWTGGFGESRSFCPASGTRM